MPRFVRFCNFLPQAIGRTAAYGSSVITLMPSGGFAGPITFIVGMLPSWAACSFSAAALTLFRRARQRRLTEGLCHFWFAGGFAVSLGGMQRTSSSSVFSSYKLEEMITPWGLDFIGEP